MNKPDKKLCDVCNEFEPQGDCPECGKSSGLLMNNNTPDTEWKRQLRIDFEVAYGSMPKNFEHVPSVHISDWWLEKLSSRDTYWKERVDRAFVILDTNIQELVTYEEGRVSKESVLTCVRRIKRELDNLK